MSHVVFAAGTSHTPLLTFSAELWEEYARRDTKNQRLNTLNGDYISYDMLLERVQGRFAPEATYEVFVAKNAICQNSIHRIAGELKAARPDVVIIITDDESELFGLANTPAVSIYYGETGITLPYAFRHTTLDRSSQFYKEMTKQYLMDKSHSFPAMPIFSKRLIELLIEKHVDVGAAAQIKDPERSGFGHGIGFVINRLLSGLNVPVIPVLLNTYYPPNVPVPARCFDIGRALRDAIENSGQELRVAVIASGGLSHFVVEEELDRNVLHALRNNDYQTLRSIPVKYLNAGSSEIRNWIAMAGAIEGLVIQWDEYQPLYRTEAGTGVGAAFAVWRDPNELRSEKVSAKTE